jgi:outer membrane beta-barrel protein
VSATRHIAAALALALAAFAWPRPAAAQSKSDAFAGKIPPVSGQLFQKAGRLEIVPSADLSLNDAFFTKYFAGLEVGYHATESLSFSASVAGGVATRSGSAVRCSASAGCANASEAELRQVPGRIKAISALGVAWAPVYGKLNVLAEKVAHFDLAVLAGLDAISHDEVLSGADAALLQANGGSPKLATTPGFHLGLGAHLFISEAMAVRLLVKDVVYPVKVPNNGSGNDWQNQLFTEIGFSLFFPTHNRQR